MGATISCVSSFRGRLINLTETGGYSNIVYNRVRRPTGAFCRSVRCLGSNS